MELKLSKLMGISNANLPQMRIIDFKGERVEKFAPDKPVEYNNILVFLSEWKKGELVSYYGSEKLLEKEMTSNIIKITSNLFYEKVLSNPKHVVVFFHTKWCGYCKKVY